MDNLRSANGGGVASLSVEDEDLASQSSARLLISGATPQGVEVLARRVHVSGPRAPYPFVHIHAASLPVGRPALRAYCVRVLSAAAGGSVLLSAVEEMPAPVQRRLIELLEQLESGSPSSAPIRLISGTTVSLLDRVNAGTFSEPLFYRLNIIHLNIDAPPPIASGKPHREHA
jgi:DNA-binding NtrC family response regulator